MIKFFTNPITLAILIVVAFVAITFYLTNKKSKKSYAGKSNVEIGNEGEAKVAEILDYVT